MITGNEYELKLLGDYVSYPKETRRCIEKFLVTDEAFTNDNCRAAFHLLNEAKDISNESERFKIVAEALNLDTTNSEARNELQNDYTDPIPSAVQVTAHHLAMNLYNSRVREASILATNSCDDCADGESLQEKVRLAIEEIPKPPKLGEHTVEAEIAEQLKKAKQEDIPEKLLHVPGFIDDVVDYSLKSAFSPNRTLSFAGALALTAHLAARRYTDPFGTRTNLFIFALGPTGLGKEHVRKLNRRILREVNPYIARTVQDDIVSGEALDEVILRYPRTLYQHDEVQSLILKLKDKRDKTSIGLASKLMSIFSAAGEEYTKRSKAGATDEIGYSVWDPSLTMLATGNAESSFASLTKELVAEGLFGRCLMFDSEILGDLNDLDKIEKTLPKNLIAMAVEFGNAVGNLLDTKEKTFDPYVVLYEPDALEYVTSLSKKTREKQKECLKDGDDVGNALWSRASEKITKLALIAAISQTRDKEKLRVHREHVDWAWKLVQFLLKRMTQRYNAYRTDGKIEEFCRDIIDALVFFKGTATQRDIYRKKHLTKCLDTEKAFETLEARGQIKIDDLGKKSYRCRLIGK